MRNNSEIVKVRTGRWCVKGLFKKVYRVFVWPCFLGKSRFLCQMLCTFTFFHLLVASDDFPLFCKLFFIMWVESNVVMSYLRPDELFFTSIFMHLC